jgi:hypothetical protein
MRRVVVLVLLFILPGAGQASGAAASTAGQKQRALHRLALLHTVTRTSLKGYSSRRFPHWLDRDGNGCDAREDTLIGAGTHVTRGPGCVVRSGIWIDEYSGRTHRSPRAVTADHLVSLANAWRTGARRWSRTRRAQYANDPIVLVVTSTALDRLKGNRSPDQWKPPRRGDWFSYAVRWIRIKTKYHLRVTRRERAALRKMLDVVPGAGDPQIAAAGDIACDPASSSFNGGFGTGSVCRQKAVSDLMVGRGYSAVLPLGDNQYYCGGLSAYERSYALSWGRLLSATHPVVGNHEYLASGGTACDATSEARGYFGYFGARAGTIGQGYYSFDIGTWHLIALNSSCSSAGGCGPSSPQGRWLTADLAAHRDSCVLAYWHIPLFSSGGRAAGNSRPFWTALYTAGADVVLNGHDHIYERFAPQTPNGMADVVRGLREFVVGTGGANHTSLSTLFANSEVRNTNTFGILKLTLHPTSYDWQFLPAPGTGAFADSGSQACHA